MLPAVAPPAAGDNRLLGIITGLFLLGDQVSGDDEELHRQHIAWEFRSGQWVMLTDEHDRLLGWLSWYRVDEERLALLRDLEIAALEQLGEADDVLTVGPHMYFATVLVTPWAPDGTFMRLCQLAGARNPDVATVSWHHRYPDGRSRFVQRTSTRHAEIGLCL